MRALLLALPLGILPLLTLAAPIPDPNSFLNNALGLLANDTDVAMAITAISGILTRFQAVLAAAENITTTENGLSAGNGTMPCTAMTVLFARGTTEPGNVGVLAGPPFFEQVRAMMPAGTVTVQGIDYPADTEGFLAGGSAAGSQVMATVVQQVLTKCPQTKLVMSGYSQGGQLLHNAAAMLPAATMAKVDSVVIFGDPDNGKAVSNVTASRVKVICHPGDNICAGGDAVLVPHLTYGADAGAAAMFVGAQSALGIDNAMAGMNGTTMAKLTKAAAMMGISG